MIYEDGVNTMAELGKTISTLRKKNNLTQEELANKLGISAQAVSKWENNISCPDIYMLSPLASVLGVSVDALLSGKTEDDEYNETDAKKDAPKKKLSTVRICVRKQNEKDINVKVPIKLINFGLKIGGAFGGPNDEQIGIINQAIQSGLDGEILNVDGENGENIIISLE